MITLDPMVGAAQANAAGTPANPTSPATPGINELGPDAFITLLTAQLQAQDPLNPMDPNQMVTELTSMNTLQETIQIRQDMDALVAAGKAAATGTPPAPAGANAASALNLSVPAQGGSNNTNPPLAAAALSSGLAAFVKSMVPGASHFAAPSNYKSRLF
jgi:flagellar basal-body rod modification protein FlgD